MILITGASGFIGTNLVQRLKDTHQICLVLRKPRINSIFNQQDIVIIPDISATTNWEPYLKNITVVIHLAGRAHIMKDTALSPLAEFRKVNVDLTLNLARQAAAIGVKRFIFLSSIKVNGEATGNFPYEADGAAAPEDPYGLSKFEAEQGLLDLAKSSLMDVVIIRPPLVYGPGVKGNFARMLTLLEKGLPLPLKSITNKRSLVSVYNLTDFLIRCIDSPQAANQIFLISDNEDLSTTELMTKIASLRGNKLRLLPFPEKLLMLIAQLFSKGDMVGRLCGSLQVDINKNKELLSWLPPFTVDESLKKTFDRENNFV